MNRRTRTSESLLGLLGALLGIVGMAIHSTVALLAPDPWMGVWTAAVHWAVLMFLVFVTVFSVPSKIQADHVVSGKMMLIGGLVCFFFSWFTMIAGVLMVIGGLLAFRKDVPRKGRRRKTA